MDKLLPTQRLDVLAIAEEILLDKRLAYRQDAAMKSDPVDRLAQWIARGRLLQQEAAEIIGLDPTELSHLLTRRRRPGLKSAVKIEEHTGILARAWVSSPSDKGARDAETAA